MLAHSIIVACPAFTFSIASSAKCIRAIGGITELCRPRCTPYHISSFDHGRPVCVGQPICDHSFSSSPAGCDVAMPDGHIPPLHFGGSSVGGGRTLVPMGCPQCYLLLLLLKGILFLFVLQA
jgi:hypothetical protein